MKIESPLKLIKGRINEKGTAAITKIKEGEIIPETIDKGSLIFEGGESLVRRVRIKTERAESGPYFYKEYKHSQIQTPVNALKIYVRLKYFGLPVPNTYRLVDDGEKYTGILMSDLSRNGKDLVVGANTEHARQHILHIKDINEGILPTHLKNISIDERKEEEKLTALANKISKANIQIKGLDCIFAVIDEKGEISYVFSDMGNLKINEQIPPEDLMLANKEKLLGILFYLSLVKRIVKEEV